MNDRDLRRGRRPRAALMLAMTIALAAGRAGAQGIEPGDEVVLASPGEVLKVEDRVVADGKVHRVFTVGQANGEWLWLEAEDVAGWVKADRVVPFDLCDLFEHSMNRMREQRRGIDRDFPCTMAHSRGRHSQEADRCPKADRAVSRGELRARP